MTNNKTFSSLLNKNIFLIDGPSVNLSIEDPSVNLSIELTSSETNSSEINSSDVIRALQLAELNNLTLKKVDFVDDHYTSNERTFMELFLVSILLGILILSTIFGNIFVISAIVLEKNLKSVGNYLVLSLAVTDLLVACLVMPLGAVYEVLQEWTFGSELCELWTSIDVLCCTASILHLLAIALDRFWAVTNVDYVHQRNTRHIGAMILTVWIVAFVISLAPIFGWKDQDFHRRIKEERKCLVSQELSYQIFATIFSFYVPSILVLFLYYRIYLEAKKRIRRKSSNLSGNKKTRRINSSSPAPTTMISTEMTTITNNISSSSSNSNSYHNSNSNSYHNSNSNSYHNSNSNSYFNSNGNSYQMINLSMKAKSFLLPSNHNSNNKNSLTISDMTSGASTSDYLEVPEIQKENSSNGNQISQESPSCSSINGYDNDSGSTERQNVNLKKIKFKKSKSSSYNEVENKRERKAAKTLAIITGIFIICWLPFFVVAIIMPLCQSCYVSSSLFSFCIWLGWANSSVNPFLYTIFSPDFRCAFRKMIFGKKHRTKKR